MSFNSANGQDVFAATAAETVENLPEVIARPAKGLQVVEERLPNGNMYHTVMLGQRELNLFEARRASFMELEVIAVNGSAVDVLTAQTGFGRGVQQYYLGRDGLDHLCFTRTVNGGRVILVEYAAKNYASSHNPELVNKYTGFLKSYNGRVYQTIQYRMLVSEGKAFDGITPVDAYEDGISLLGAACQMGGWKKIRPQLTKAVALANAGGFVAMLDGVHFFQFLGHMGQSKLAPLAWFVEAVPGYQERALVDQKCLTAALVDPTKCLDAWIAMTKQHAGLVAEGKLGVFMTLS